MVSGVHRFIIAGIIGAGCAGSDGEPTGTGSCEDQPMDLVVGTGASAFEELADDDPVTIVHGPQGGWHVEVAGVVSNTGQEVGIQPRIVVLVTDQQIAGEQQQTLTALSSYDDASCTGEFFNVDAFVDDVDGTNQTRICQLQDQPATLELTVEDFNTGQTVTESISVVLQTDPGDPCG